jgi:hypothetical protein
MSGPAAGGRSDRFVRMCTTGLTTTYNPSGAPLLNFDFPDARLRDLLFFDRQKAEAALFDPNAQLPAAAQLTINRQALWHLMSTFSDPTYQELFTQTRDLSLSDLELGRERASPSAVEIVFRKKPFAGRIDATGSLVGIADARASQFDPEFASANTVPLTDLDVVAMNLMRTSRDVRNLYFVYPQVPGFNNPEDFRALHPPLIDGERLAPASARRFGPRLIEVADYYMRLPGSSLEPPQPSQDAFEQATVREQLLWAWHRFEPLFWRGDYTLRGNPALRIGQRMTHSGRNIGREYYVQAVTHSMTIGSQQPRFITQINVDRGWPVDIT